jgi:hypothetical protein
MELRRIDTIRLENGLILKLYDSSRRVAADRWLVCFVALVEIQVRPEYFESEDLPDISFGDVRSVVGQRITYRHEKTRKFVAETEKDEVFRGLKERYLKATLTYLSSANFPRKAILSRHQDMLAGPKPLRVYRRTFSNP